MDPPDKITFAEWLSVRLVQRFPGRRAKVLQDSRQNLEALQGFLQCAAQQPAVDLAQGDTRQNLAKTMIRIGKRKRPEQNNAQGTGANNVTCRHVLVPT